MTEPSPKVPLLDLPRQYAAIRGEIDQAIAHVLSTASFIGGSAVRDFEAAFGAYVGVSHCVGVANGTDALELALEAIDLPKGGEIIVPASSFIATSEAVTRSGYHVVFADIDEDTHALDPADVARRITDRTVALIPVHLYGHPAPMDDILELAARHGLAVIEDAAQAHGAEVGQRRVGGLGTVATFSFYPGKNLGAYGDAGAITTNSEALAQKIRMLANHGRVSKYAHEFEGRNSRLDALQAAVLSVKLRHLDAWTARRREIASRYGEGLTGIGDLVLPGERAGAKHVYHLYAVRTSERDRLRAHLGDMGIETGIHYPTILPRLAAYASHPQHRDPFVADRLAGEILSLPMGDSIDDAQVDRVIDGVRSFFAS